MDTANKPMNDFRERIRAWIRGMEEVSEALPAEIREAKYAEIRETMIADIHAKLVTFPNGDLEGRIRWLLELESAFKETFKQIGAAIEKSYKIFETRQAHLVGRYLERSGESQRSLKLKPSTTQPEEFAFVKALRAQADRMRRHMILDAIQTGRVTWQSTLSREERYGVGMDERVIEIPLAFEVGRFSSPGKVLDAGSSLSLPFLREFIGQPSAHVVHFTQSGGREVAKFEGGHFSFVFGDLRNLDFKDGTFDRILCVSTLEHIGMDNTRYGGPKENAPESYIHALRELLRVLTPGGQLLVTFPYGIARDFGWFHSFDEEAVSVMQDIAAGCEFGAKYYYYDGCWYEGTSKGEQPLLINPEEKDVNGLAALRIEKKRDGF